MKFCLVTILVIFALISGGYGHSKKRERHSEYEHYKKGLSHSVTWGSRTFKDRHLERVIISRKSSFLRVVTRDYKYQPKGYKRRITQIVVTDQIRDGKGGYAVLKAGGPHSKYAHIRFKSQRNKGFSFIVDIYGI